MKEINDYEEKFKTVIKPEELKEFLKIIQKYKGKTMTKDRMKYLLCEMIDKVDTLNKCKLPYKSTYDILKEDMNDNEMKELGLDIEYLKGC